jgi:uncharacterized protein (TIGR02391 family)
VSLSLFNALASQSWDKVEQSIDWVITLLAAEPKSWVERYHLHATQCCGRRGIAGGSRFRCTTCERPSWREDDPIAQDVRDIRPRGVRYLQLSDVLKFCREELLADNYFHAVLEAVKSVGEKIRAKTGLTDDGGPLIDRALGGTLPMLAINPLLSESEISEQRGFANLVRGAFGMFRNPTAHAARITWEMSKEDAEDLFSIVSLLHRRLDKAVMPPRS